MNVWTGVWRRVLLVGAVGLLIAAAAVTTSLAADYPQAEQGKAAFVRDKQLWIQTGKEEKRVTAGEQVHDPRWSHDGNWVAFTSGEQTLKLYDVAHGQQITLADAATNYQWAPHANKLAFLTDTVLQVTDVGQLAEQKFRNAAMGVGNYSWLPDGSGFLVSTQAQLLPDGWSDFALYQVPLTKDEQLPKGTLLLRIPSESNSFFAVGTGTFQWSHDKRWVAFIATPTASLSADGNTLCAWFWSGNKVIPVGDMLNRDEWFRWSPQVEQLAFIRGTGRDATTNKSLVVKRPPFRQETVLTPAGYVDRDFTWVDDAHLVVSRAVEMPNGAVNTVQPALIAVPLAGGSQTPVTQPPAGYGDERPQYETAARKLTWVRSNGTEAAVWVSNPNGEHAAPWIASIDQAPGYYGQLFWDEVVAIYRAPS